MIKKDIFVRRNASIKETLKKLDKTAEKVLLVVDTDDRLLGTVTDGDIRRFVLGGGNLESTITDIYNERPKYFRQDEFTVDAARDYFLKDKIDLIPIVNSQMKVTDFITWGAAFLDSVKQPIMRSAVDLPVIIMAGGKSTRLEPITRIIPKPLIPIGDKTIVEVIIDEFKKHGVNNYYLILNFKSEIIESYFKNIKKDYNMEFVQEQEFLGTAGGLNLIKDKIADTFIVSNCDVIVKANLEDVVSFHRKNKAALTVLSSFQHYKIPYGVVKFEDGGKVTDIIEKPEYTYMVNTGVYILDKSVLKFIPKDTYFDMTDLIKSLMKNKVKVVTYPVNENDYIDIGQWEEYKKALEKLQFVR